MRVAQRRSGRVVSRERRFRESADDTEAIVPVVLGGHLPGGGCGGDSASTTPGGGQQQQMLPDGGPMPMPPPMPMPMGGGGGGPMGW